jgi:hypothetical protein
MFQVVSHWPLYTEAWFCSGPVDVGFVVDEVTRDWFFSKYIYVPLSLFHQFAMLIYFSSTDIM